MKKLTQNDIDRIKEYFINSELQLIRKTDTFEDLDSKLAHALYRYLVEGIDDLPSLNLYEKAFSNPILDLISIGYGFEVTTKLEIVHTTPISNDLNRIDIISPDEYRAFITEPIDVQTSPIFSPEKVNALTEQLRYVKKNIMPKKR